jgi:hypothetical protein
MNMSGRKGNWNEMAGSPKHESANPADKKSKKVRGKELLGHLQQEPGKTKSGPHKPIAKI